MLAQGAFFDGAGGTQTPEPVARAIAEALTGGLSQRGGAYPAARNSDDIVTSARAAMADFLGVSEQGVVFGRSATQLIFDFADTLTAGLGAGDEIVVSRLDHDANIRPWVLATERVGATLRWIDFDPATGDLSPADVAQVLGERTRIVAMTAASNLFGTMPDIPAIARLVHDAGATFFVDAVAYAPHALVDFEELGADFLVCSTYKFCGPHLGVLAARPETLEALRPRKLLPAPDVVPERFEQGTLPYELLAGLIATIDFFAGHAPAHSDAPVAASDTSRLAGDAGRPRRGQLRSFYVAAGRHENLLAEQIVTGLAEIPGVRRIGAPVKATPTVLFTMEGHSVHSIAEYLGERGIAVSAGTFYAHEAATWANLAGGGIRLSIAPYTSDDDARALLAAVGELAATGS